MAVHSFIPPILVALLSIPLVFKKIPRNPLYGYRTEYTMSSDNAWYSTNKAAGAGGVMGGILWLLALVLLPILGMPQLYAMLIGLALLIASLAVAVNIAV